MLKSIKIPEKAYKSAKILSDELEKDGAIKGQYNVSISLAISYAIERTMEDIEKKKKFKKAAGSWADLDTDKIIKEIYDQRKKGSKTKTPGE